MAVNVLAKCPRLLFMMLNTTIKYASQNCDINDRTSNRHNDQDGVQVEHTNSPGADPHERDGGAGKEDSHEEKRLPAPDI